MATWSILIISTIVLNAVVGLPTPDESKYEIPEVGTNQRSQYYVLHDDGSFKYGYDTGDNHFESLKTHAGNEGMGKFGYKNSDGEDVHVEYTAGVGGFQAQGSHIPKVHPDVEAVFEAAKSRGPYEDPLADAEGDRSFNFQFEGDEYSRNEVSDDDGTITGSYSYIDEFGNTITRRYRAGKGIGFQIEGDDIPQQVQPLQVGSQTTHVGGLNRAHNTASSTSFAANRRRDQKVTSNTYYSQSNHIGTQSHSSGASHSSSTGSGAQTYSQSHTGVVPPNYKVSSQSSEFEAANTRTSFSPSGSYSLAYETNTHTRQESGDDDNNVEGSFTFITDDDDTQRSVTYKAGSDTGFVAQGAHLPVGPVVPGASNGQPTGEKEEEHGKEFVDPLAKEDMDASYNFNFESEGYSRSETADEDGNISGTYTVLGEDGYLRTFEYKAGRGIGFHPEEVSSVRFTGDSTSASSSQSAFGSGSGYTSNRKTTTQSASSHGHRGSTTYSGSTAHIGSTGVRKSHNVNKISSSRTDRNEIFPGFTLRQYDASEGRGKYGYVLKFDK